LIGLAAKGVFTYFKASKVNFPYLFIWKLPVLKKRREIQHGRGDTPRLTWGLDVNAA